MAGRKQRHPHLTTSAISPLRQARQAIPATLEQVCHALERRGHPGVSAGMLSAWETGRHVTSLRYRKVLCEFYGRPPTQLFAHQDRKLTGTAETPRLLVGHHDLSDAMIDVVQRAQNYLVVLGSRSRDEVYLRAIETVLAARAELVHYRVLFGPPRHQVLKDHLLRLLELRDPHDRSRGLKTLHIGMIDDDPGTPERFLCASESCAVVPVPSVTSAEAFDSGVLFAAGVAERYVDHARQCYAAARKIETAHAVRALPAVRSWTETTAPIPADRR
ncbi:helix-turn-helix domain-containing protein [Amycolatopsis sp. NPDC059021]|uniref:helix-turn-helix domain-containing protein n=1 Tax=Amycolatopsis sp. NPDC059021 TaxID=3346704 RepID=UPI00366F7D75